MHSALARFHPARDLPWSKDQAPHSSKWIATLSAQSQLKSLPDDSRLIELDSFQKLEDIATRRARWVNSMGKGYYVGGYAGANRMPELVTPNSPGDLKLLQASSLHRTPHSVLQLRALVHNGEALEDEISHGGVTDMHWNHVDIDGWVLLTVFELLRSNKRLTEIEVTHTHASIPFFAYSESQNSKLYAGSANAEDLEMARALSHRLRDLDVTVTLRVVTTAGTFSTQFRRGEFVPPPLIF